MLTSRMALSTDLSTMASSSAHIHTDDHCNDRTDVQIQDNTKKEHMALVHPGDVVTGKHSTAATRELLYGLVGGRSTLLPRLQAALRLKMMSLLEANGARSAGTVKSDSRECGP
ncbi:hypothetical protein LR48_Vigan230s000200 [Vigna angularis]|uniref:Uncharacterized protein n=1 Tax=Phaseolus angularis TaxID=3914 RepID=A0A0L9T6X5_PHAAN|nr:hypothetical protein LR48_Vigan230s000200 [Vigna angularis]